MNEIRERPKQHLTYSSSSLTLLGPQFRFGDKSLGVRLVCPQIGTAVLKGLIQLLL